MSDDLTPEEQALLAGETPVEEPAPVETPAPETPAEEPEAPTEEPKKKRGKSASAGSTDAEDAQDADESAIEPSYFGDHATPAQWEGDPWGDTPVQMRG